MAETQQQGSPAPGSENTKKSQLVMAGAVAGVALLIVTAWAVFFRHPKGLYGQAYLDGKPAADAVLKLRIIPDDADPRDETVEADASGFFRISLGSGAYQMETTAEKKEFVSINGEELEYELARSPMGQRYVVEDELVPLNTLRIFHPGEAIGPLEGETVMPDVALQWKPYPNASQYVLDIAYLPQPNKQSQGSIYLEPEVTGWQFSLNDSLGRPNEMKIFKILDPGHPEAAFQPGAKYRWTLRAFNEQHMMKGMAGPFTFSVRNTEEAKKIALESGDRQAASNSETNGTLAGLLSENRQMVPNASFHVNLFRKVPDTGEQRSLLDVPVKTDSTGQFSIAVPPGIYRFQDPAVHQEDSLYGRVSSGEVAILLPGTSEALFDVEAGKETRVPDILLRPRVKFLFPSPGTRISTNATVVWEPYEDANRYQVTLTYVDPAGRPNNIWVKVINTDSVDLSEVEVTEQFARENNHPRKGLKPGASYRIHVIAFKEPRRKREWDMTTPPPPWIKLSESLPVLFYVEG